MKIKIVKKTENKLLDRVELDVEIDHQGEPVPTRDTVLARVAAEVNKEKNQVVLIKVQTKFGIGISHATIHAYNTSERAIEVEREHLLKRSGVLEDK